MSVFPPGVRASLAIDIDGVLTDFRKCRRCDHGDLKKRRYMLCPPKERVVDHLRRLNGKYRIILHTARGEENREVTEKWLRLHGIPYDELVMDKPYALYYIDDRAIEFKDWPQTLKAINA
ncbi:MAG: hypothetical protein GF416_01900 [Candidatus Altiarchaeales archaeon]|nr:hypothetical protein [Candidatus Altiarchaeales archaeon]MBD3415870.1 hypothetical protein [Candidatus Altiarchaeales archaeon]